MTPLQARLGVVAVCGAVGVVAVNAMMLQTHAPGGAWTRGSATAHETVADTSSRQMRPGPSDALVVEPAGETPSGDNPDALVTVDPGVASPAFDAAGREQHADATGQAPIEQGSVDDGPLNIADLIAATAMDGPIELVDVVPDDEPAAGHAGSPRVIDPAPANGARADGEESAQSGTTPDAKPLVSGDDSGTVIAVQRHLMNQGYLPGEINGQMRPQTRAAIFAYQLDRGLPLTADADQDLAMTLFAGSAAVQRPADASDLTAVTLQSTTAQHLIWRLQGQLIGLGEGRLTPNGQLDRSTRLAIADYETALGLARTGRPSGSLVVALDVAAGLAPISGGEWVAYAKGMAEPRGAQASPSTGQFAQR